MSLDHSAAVRGHKRTGLSVSLSGNEDHLINRDARVFWDELGLGRVRDQEVKAIREAVASGRLSWCRADLESLREPFPNNNDMGILREGQELEGVCGEGEVLWDEDNGSVRDSSSDTGEHPCESIAIVPIETALPIVDTDTTADIRAAEVFAQRLKTLRTVEAQAKLSSLPAVQSYVQREIRKMERLRSSTEESRPASGLLRRFVRAQHEDEERRLEKAREKNARVARQRAALKRVRIQDALATAKAKAKYLASRSALAKLPCEFSTDMLGQGHVSGGIRAHIDCRIRYLERLRLRSPPLPVELEGLWPEFVSRYARAVGARHGAAVGVRMIEIVRQIADQLGEHLRNEDGQLMSGTSDGSRIGDPDAFGRFVRSEYRKLPRAASSHFF